MDERCRVSVLVLFRPVFPPAGPQYLGDVPKQLPLPAVEGVVSEAPPPGHCHALACRVDGCKLNTHTNISKYAW